MSIITVWNDTREQSGKTLTSVAIALRMAMERNNKILLISTSFDDSTLKDCLWGNEYSKNVNFFNTKTSNIAVENGMEGLMKLILSNKLTPQVITDYTKVVFKERLEVVPGVSVSEGRTLEESLELYRKAERSYIDLIRMANQYYDIVIVDLDKMLNQKTREDILKMSSVNIYVLSQKLSSINRYNELRKINVELMKNRCIPVIGRYDDRFKYNSKNIARYLGDRKELHLIPLNLLYMAAAEEVGVADLFLKLRNIKDQNDENYIFMACISYLTDNIYTKLKEMQMRMR